MFFLPPQQMAAFQKAKFQAWMSLTDKYMDGFQKLTQLNVQTIRTLISENEGVTGPAPENASDVNEWQSKLLTQVPEKAASYSRHFFAIVSATGEQVARAEYRRGPRPQWKGRARSTSWSPAAG